MRRLGLFILGLTLVLAAYLGYLSPNNVLSIAPHAITVSAILAGIMGAAQNLLTHRSGEKIELSDREGKVREADSKDISKGLYDQLLVHMLVIVLAIMVIWNGAATPEAPLVAHLLCALFMSVFVLGLFLTLRLPTLLKELSD